MTSPIVTDISQLFLTDPLKLTRTDITAMVEEFRKSRVAFNLGNLKAGSTKPKAEPKGKSDVGELDL